jgi:hypothetical protein
LGNAIANFLNENGFTTTRSRNWSKQAVSLILMKFFIFKKNNRLKNPRELNIKNLQLQGFWQLFW